MGAVQPGLHAPTLVGILWRFLTLGRYSLNTPRERDLVRAIKL